MDRGVSRFLLLQQDTITGSIMLQLAKAEVPPKNRE